MSILNDHISKYLKEHNIFFFKPENLQQCLHFLEMSKKLPNNNTLVTAAEFGKEMEQNN